MEFRNMQENLDKAKLFQVNDFFGNHRRVYLLVVNSHGCFDHGD